MLTRWDPFAEMSRLQNEISRSVGDPRRQPFAPAVDILETKDAILVKAELPGVKSEDVHVNVENNVLTVSGERRLEHEDEKDGYHRVERWYGSFQRSFALPRSVDSETIEAKLDAGVLTVRIPKKAEVQPRRIAVS